MQNLNETYIISTLTDLFNEVKAFLLTSGVEFSFSTYEADYEPIRRVLTVFCDDREYANRCMENIIGNSFKISRHPNRDCWYYNIKNEQITIVFD